jgi:hypothetical protein
MTAQSRRDLLKAAAAAPLMGGLAACVTAAEGASPVPGHQASAVPSTETLDGWLRQLHRFGPIRATGTSQCRAFEEFLATEFGKLGCEVRREQFRLTSWECDLADCFIAIDPDDNCRPGQICVSDVERLNVVAYYPFAASTKTTGLVSGRVLFGGTGENCGPEILARYPAEQLAESIVVIDMPLAGGGVRGTVRYYPESFPNPLPEPVAAPRGASQGGRGPMAALEGKCKGIIFCYTDVSDEAARYNYLPFSDQHRTIPALWVGKRGSDYLKSVSGKARATIKCDAKLTPDARADSLLAILKGETDEVIYMTTHTDGPNEVNDNGALGLLAAATYLSKIPNRKRTVVFSLPTGHYAAGAIADARTGSGRRAGTGGNMAKWPEFVDRAVAQIALEQMGAMEWADVDGRWGPTGRVAPENWIPTPAVAPTINKLMMACTPGLDPRFSRVGLVESGQAPGEGGGLRTRGIPGVGLMGSPHYFFRCDPAGVIDKLSPRVMRNQVLITTRLLALMDRLSPAQLKGESPIGEAELRA